MSRGLVSIGLHGHLEVDEGDVDGAPGFRGRPPRDRTGPPGIGRHGVQQPRKLRRRNALPPAAREQQVQPGSGGRVGRGWMVGMEGHRPNLQDPCRMSVGASVPIVRTPLGMAGLEATPRGGPRTGANDWSGEGDGRRPDQIGPTRPPRATDRALPGLPSGSERPGDAANLARGGRLAAQPIAEPLPSMAQPPLIRIEIHGTPEHRHPSPDGHRDDRPEGPDPGMGPDPTRLQGRPELHPALRRLLLRHDAGRRALRSPQLRVGRSSTHHGLPP